MSVALEQAEDGMRYTLPPRKVVGQMIIAPVLLAAWAFGEALAIRMLGEPSMPMLEQIVWLIFWTLAGLGTLYDWLSQAVGRELITLSSGTLKIKRNVVGFEPTREYDMATIRNLRVSSVRQNWHRRRQLSGFANGPIAFDYGPKTMRFGAGVGEEEARMIVDELRRDYGLGSTSSTTGHAALSHGSPISSPSDAR